MPKMHYIIPVFVPHAGCPHQCVFCNQKHISGRRAVPTGEEVEGQIKEYLQTIGDPAGKTVEVAFFGGSFTAIPEELQQELLAPARAFWEAGRVDYLRLSTRPDCIDRQNLAWLSDWGVRVIELGVQSMDAGVLAAAKRGHTAEEVRDAAALVKSMGFQLGLQMMVGLPGDSPDKARETARELVSLKPDFVRIYPVLVIRGTELAEMYLAGQYRPWDLLTTVEVCKDLLKLFAQADIPVIRIGLQASEQVNFEGDVLAGPFHPALRELVESAWARERIEGLLRQAGLEPVDNAGEQVLPVEQVVLQVSPRDISIVRGQRNSNICYFRRVWGINLKVEGNPDLPRRSMICSVKAS
ncbi:MAG: radical SAM protein [Clostridia bacterium]|nr:radical SAM protein [Clostridia bacterium]